MIETIENEIIKTLKENFEQFEVDSFPVEFQHFQFTSHTGCLLVRYEDSTSEVQNTLTSVMSNEVHSFSVFLALRYLAKHIQAYQHVNKLRTVLNGLPILNKKLVLNKIEFIDNINGDLWYGAEISINLPIIDIYRDLSIANKNI